MQKHLQPNEEQPANLPDEWPAKLAQPARRALRQAGYTRLEQLTSLTEAELAKLHGVGPKAVEQLRAALAATGTSFAPANKSFAASDEAAIRALLQQWAEATRVGQSADILAHHAPDATIFDVLPPLKYEGVAAYRKSWDKWQPAAAGPILFELHKLKITAGDEVAFAHALIQCGGTRPDGRTFEDWVRATFGLCKQEGQWLLTHQHISLPYRTNAGVR